MAGGFLNKRAMVILDSKNYFSTVFACLFFFGISLFLQEIILVLNNKHSNIRYIVLHINIKYLMITKG